MTEENFLVPLTTQPLLKMNNPPPLRTRRRGSGRGLLVSGPSGRATQRMQMDSLSGHFYLTTDPPPVSSGPVRGQDGTWRTRSDHELYSAASTPESPVNPQVRFSPVFMPLQRRTVQRPLPVSARTQETYPNNDPDNPATPSPGYQRPPRSPTPDWMKPAPSPGTPLRPLPISRFIYDDEEPSPRPPVTPQQQQRSRAPTPATAQLPSPVMYSPSSAAGAAPTPSPQYQQWRRGNPNVPTLSVSEILQRAEDERQRRRDPNLPPTPATIEARSSSSQQSPATLQGVPKRLNFKDNSQ